MEKTRYFTAENVIITSNNILAKPCKSISCKFFGMPFVNSEFIDFKKKLVFGYYQETHGSHRLKKKHILATNAMIILKKSLSSLVGKEACPFT